ncbi:MAG: hypothetical protein Q9217_000714 [Psora testacea]
MRSKYSPPPSPLKPYKDDYRPRSAALLRYRSRILYTILALLILFLYNTSNIHLFPVRAPIHAPSLIYKNIDWSRYAYSQYATNSAYLCNAVMVFESLSRLGSKADRILLYPQEWDLEISGTSDRDSQLLVKARDWYHVKLIPVDIGKTDDDAWNGSFTKFMTWRQTEYDRVLHLDSDVTVLKNLDELFVLPSAPVAMLRAYWQLPEQRKLTSLFILLEPSEQEYQRLMTASRPDHRPKGEYDMEILNRFYRDSAMILPHRQYGLLSGEFRGIDHSNFLSNYFEKWNPDLIYREASLVHFSDWPLPKPWVMWPHQLIGEIMPKCKYAEGGMVDNCKDKEIWVGLYDDFRKRRKEVCALLSAPAPEWPPRNTT